MISSWAGTLELCFRHILHSATPYSFLRISPIFTRRLSELNLVFSMRPIRLPRRESGLGT